MNEASFFLDCAVFPWRVQGVVQKSVHAREKRRCGHLLAAALRKELPDLVQIAEVRRADVLRDSPRRLVWDFGKTAKLELGETRETGARSEARSGLEGPPRPAALNKAKPSTTCLFAPAPRHRWRNALALCESATQANLGGTIDALEQGLCQGAGRAARRSSAELLQNYAIFKHLIGV